MTTELGELEQELEEFDAIKLSRLKRLGRWATSRYIIRNERDKRISRIASGSLVFFATLAMSLATMGMPTGLGKWLDQILFLAANGVGLWLAGWFITFILSLCYVPFPRKLTAITLYAAGESYFIFFFSDFGIWPSIVMGGLYTLMALGLGLGLGWLMSIRMAIGFKAGVAAITAACLVGIMWLPFAPGPEELPKREVEAAGLNNDTLQEVMLPQAKSRLDNPSTPGHYSFSTLSYGSGQDRRQEEFGDETDILSPSVDASAYITSWSKLKTAFWGFDQHRLPLNGRVWVPEGEGPFPLVLMVHGNHIMEDFSDGGYEYLGELLASRGMIAVSVDANFMNYSVWSSLPNDDMKMRAWLLLQHLAYLNTLGENNQDIFAANIDWQSVALIGHSRGGQAVAMAADAKRWFSEDAIVNKVEDIHIQSVIAIAPTDKRVEDEAAELIDIHYLTIQGALDGDVNNFYGDRQYNRVSFTNREDRFKAEIYISNANHSQFNTDWGRMDERLPGGLFLNAEQLMDEDEQRLVAEVYISAFLEATLHGNTAYKALFQNYRIGEEWLPDSTRYVNRYEGSDMLMIDDFEGYSSIVSTDEAMGMEKEETTVKDRDGNGKGTSGMKLQWSKPDASYSLNFREAQTARLSDYKAGSLTFSLANMEWLIQDKKLLPPLPDIELIITDLRGRSWSVLLGEVDPLQPPSYAAFMKFGWLEHRVKDNKYKQPAETVLQSFVIPFELFRPDDGSEHYLSIHEMTSLTFKFHSDEGQVMIDDIGMMNEGGTYVEYKSSP
ncbi:alpha/beta hydrolase [Paenibacillus sp. strain BS8-2]